MLVFVSVTRTRNAAKPNGFIVKEFSIAKNDKNWTISLLPGDCGSHIPLLAVVNADRNADSTRDSAVFTKKGLNSSALATRLQKASPRVRGTFNIHYHGKVVTGKYIKRSYVNHCCYYGVQAHTWIIGATVVMRLIPYCIDRQKISLVLTLTINPTIWQ